MPDMKGAIAFPGPEGSFSQQAAVSFFGKDKQYLPYETFGGVLAALINGDTDYAVLPIENSSAGGVLETYDLLLKNELHIVGEQVATVAHHLRRSPGVHWKPSGRSIPIPRRWNNAGGSLPPIHISSRCRP